ncbi:GTPase IMAP family member 7-like [Anoplopoma fimbria]|uniref:GTPase IMAP family member 7-like n=1 Tax=Anoplopoma fimbria TaxID=229290 RepID=UPI0023EB96DC|nr:GTPase IMAP family member 7-like [Anoplopoma fimbria]
MASMLNAHSRPPKGLKIVVIGKIGVGKSASGNTVLMREAFRSRLSSTAVTQICQTERGELDGQTLVVVDTPGLFGLTSSDPSAPSDANSQDAVMKEVQKCVSLAPPGPVVFLVVIQMGRFTRDERETVKIIQRTFGLEAAHSTMALFTRGDDLKTDGRSVEAYIGADPAVRDFIRECFGVYHVFDNRDRDPSQVVELMQKINNTVQRNGASGSTGEGSGILQLEAQERGGGRRQAAGGPGISRDLLVGGLAVAIIALLIYLARR